MSERAEIYASRLSRMIQHETVSSDTETNITKFTEMHSLLREEFPHLFAVCEYENFDGSFLLHWKGRNSDKKPVIFMNHHDVVEATGEWKYDPFSGKIAEGKVWGRGTLDTKGGLFAMLQAADELASEGFTPDTSVYFESSSSEETSGIGCDTISKALEKRGIRFSMSLDEGGMTMYEPISGAKGTFAMIGVGEKGCADLKFIAKSNGGHASVPGKGTPLVRLGQFMAACEKSDIFNAEISPTIAEMFIRLSSSMNGPMKILLGHPKMNSLLLKKAIPSVSATAAAFMMTTLAFTMAKGSGGTNVLPETAWVHGNMRFSHHQGRDNSIEAVTKLAEKFDIEVKVEDPGIETKVTDFRGEGFRLIEEAINEIFPGVVPVPYIMTGCSDSRYIERICDQCIRYTPFKIDEAQLESIHGINENVDISCLAPAVDFYKYLMKRV